MIDLRDQLARLLDSEPEAPYDIDTIVRSGRRARRRQHLAVATTSAVGAAGVAAAVAVPLLASGGNERAISLGVQPSPSAAATHGKCYLMASPRKTFKQDLARLVRSGRVGTDPTITRVKAGTHTHRVMVAVCTHGTTPAELQKKQQADTPQAPVGPPYDYTEKPATIASRLGAHLHDRVTSYGLTITYTRPFAQESSTLDSGRPTYYAGNVDVHESTGYADIGVQVTHEVTELVPFTGDCTTEQHCVETKLPDGSVLRTGQVQAGKGDVILTAEIHRPDGVIVQAQESNYPFGPDAGSQAHGEQPLTLDQLVALAKDAAFTF